VTRAGCFTLACVGPAFAAACGTTIHPAPPTPAAPLTATFQASGHDEGWHPWMHMGPNAGNPPYFDVQLGGEVRLRANWLELRLTCGVITVRRPDSTAWEDLQLDMRVVAQSNKWAMPGGPDVLTLALNHMGPTQANRLETWMLRDTIGVLLRYPKGLGPHWLEFTVTQRALRLNGTESGGSRTFTSDTLRFDSMPGELRRSTEPPGRNCGEPPGA
jgi:hypothetical protein